MTKLVANRWFRWTLLTLALSGLGVGIYRFTPPEPRCVIEGKLDPLRFLDGQKLATLSSGTGTTSPFQFEKQAKPITLTFKRGPLQVWDVRTGSEIARHFTDDQKLLGCAISSDGQQFATKILHTHDALPPTLEFLLVDMVKGTTRVLSLKNWPDFGDLRFSSDGGFLGSFADGPNGVRIYDTVTAELRDTLDGGTWSGPPLLFTADRLIHVRQRVGEDFDFLGHDLEIWNSRERKQLLARTKIRNGPPELNGAFLLFDHVTPKGSLLRHVVWNVPANRLEAELRPENADEIRGCVISPDGRFIATSCEGENKFYLELREVPTGKRVGTVPIALCGSLQFSPDGRFLAHACDAHPQPATISIYEVPSLKCLWSNSARLGWGWPNWLDKLVDFSPDSRRLLLCPHNLQEAYVLDSATGVLLTTIPRLPNGIHGRTVMSPDRRFFLAHTTGAANAFQFERAFWTGWLQWLPGFGPPTGNVDTLVVFDMDECRERLRLQDWNASSAVLSDDGCTLVTVHNEADDRRMLRCWDVNAWKPLHWALGVPTGLAAGIALFAWRRGRRKAA